jgi:hypothetical protein
MALQLILCIYALLLPVDVAEHYYLSREKYLSLMFFDFCFMTDRIIDLFIGFSKKDGSLEKSIKNVIFKNFSFSFWLEIFYVAGPFILLDLNQINAM